MRLVKRVTNNDAGCMEQTQEEERKRPGRGGEERRERVDKMANGTFCTPPSFPRDPCLR